MRRLGRVVAIGGGHGLAASLAALRTVSDEVTAVVSMADDGGSTGRLRDELQVPAVGDLRKACVALAAPDSLLAAAMTRRFEAGDLAGHAFGNLLIAALAEECGDLVGALDEIRLLTSGVGRVLPVASEQLVLCATTMSGVRLVGQVRIMGTEGLDHVGFEPSDPDVPKETLAALDDAELIVLGPGSLFTSILAAASVPAVDERLAAATVPVVYVCNLHPQVGETAGYGVADHVAALSRHRIRPTVVLYDPSTIGGAEGVPGAVPADLVRENGLAHDPLKLAEALGALG